MAMATTTQTASVITVACDCTGEKLVDLEAIGITLHCPACGGVVRAGFKSVPEAIAFLQRLAA